MSPVHKALDTSTDLMCLSVPSFPCLRALAQESRKCLLFPTYQAPDHSLFRFPKSALVLESQSTELAADHASSRTSICSAVCLVIESSGDDVSVVYISVHCSLSSCGVHSCSHLQSFISEVVFPVVKLMFFDPHTNSVYSCAQSDISILFSLERFKYVQRTHDRIKSMGTEGH